ncbi:hydantoinase/oxoprolinase family protein [Aureimonas mangrovi]|uniref:hydantoinase/oxoprolinase family protein n=1 Tax=Aureimonas mangrovi TaxID=2758041 RepID=UPI00163DD0D0|nr:hydantoinase/oxoprolinase family protein [Aureimonas mangrovi]
MGYRVGVDIGGSFTDFAVFHEETGKISSMKTFSRPDEPGAEVIEGIRLLGERYGIQPADITYFTHGTTVGINTVIQRRGLKLALFTTRNFEDVLELARLKGPDMYSLLSKRPAPLVRRSMVFGIVGRLNADGSEREPLDDASIVAAVEAARAKGAEGIVVSLLHAYRNPAHELAVRERIEALWPGVFVNCSSQTWPIIREYERTITSVIGGYVQPRVAHYLGSLQAALKRAGVDCEPRLTKSNGGVMSAEQGKRDCVQMILSGTASGVIGAAHLAKTCGIANALSLDIGGTSADISVISDGEPRYGTGELIGDFNIHIPSVSVSSVGEGGGSIAWVDDLGVLKVGPESAGSRPGPACYGRGGDRPTITDAMAATGLLGHAPLGYSAVDVDVEASRRAIAKLSDRLGESVEETAEAILNVAISGMYTEVSALISKYGIDISEFSILAFGGAGPMLGCHLAQELGVKETVIPLTPGVLSALGGLIADLKSDFLSTVYLDLQDDDGPLIANEYARLKGAAEEWLLDEQGFAGQAAVTVSADMRYKGQSYELDVPVDLDAALAGDVAAFSTAFHAEHERMYGHKNTAAPLQLISLKLVITAAGEKPSFEEQDVVDAHAEPANRVQVFMGGVWREASLFHRAALAPGHHFQGPAIVAQDDTTTVIPAQYVCRVDRNGNLRVARELAS